jgi:signal transduction histidine kinase
VAQDQLARDQLARDQLAQDQLALPGSGLGLAGIAERVASCRGQLSLGPTPAGGFSVSARLPVR